MGRWGVSACARAGLWGCSPVGSESCGRRWGANDVGVRTVNVWPLSVPERGPAWGPPRGAWSFPAQFLAPAPAGSPEPAHSARSYRSHGTAKQWQPHVVAKDAPGLGRSQGR